MDVLIVGAYGSSGKNGISLVGASCITAVAALAAGLEVVVMGRFIAKRVRGRRREALRTKDMVIEP